MINLFEQDPASIEADISEYEKDVVILDYLITAKQLIDMLANGECY
jgi:hypothetical protein